MEKDGDAVFVHGHLAATVPQLCGRCLLPFTVTVAPEIETRFVPSPSGRGEEPELAATTSRPTCTTTACSISNALIETETTLALPMKPLCRDGLPRALPGLRGQPEPGGLRVRRARARRRGWAPLKQAWAARQSR